jgi:hypothetical protein
MQVHAIYARKMAALAVVAAVIGGGSTSLAIASHHRQHHHHHHRGIPQHNLGDHDADNNGGPSDGDGRI